MTSQNDRQALEQAREAGAAEAVRQLRSFTGIAGYTPDLNEPEHRAYLAYERQLAHGLEVWSSHQSNRQARVDRLIERRDEARRVMDAEQRRRQDERADSVGGRFLGAIQDVTFPEKREHSALVKAVDEAWETRYAADDRVTEIQAELARVSHWIEQMLADVDAARAARF